MLKNAFKRFIGSVLATVDVYLYIIRNMWVLVGKYEEQVLYLKKIYSRLLNFLVTIYTTHYIIIICSRFLDGFLLSVSKRFSLGRTRILG